MNLHKKLIFKNTLETSKLFRTKQIFVPKAQILRPDKIIKFFDCMLPLNYKYLNPQELIFGYKPFSRIRYLKKIESFSRDPIKNNISFQLTNIAADKLTSEEKNIQSNLLKDWLKNINTPESLN